MRGGDYCVTILFHLIGCSYTEPFHVQNQLSFEQQCVFQIQKRKRKEALTSHEKETWFKFTRIYQYHSFGMPRNSECIVNFYY